MSKYDERWRAMDEKLSSWGRYIERMKDKADVYSEQFLLDMEKQYLMVQKDFKDLKVKTDEKISLAEQNSEAISEQMRDQTEQQMKLARENFDHLCSMAKENSEKFTEASKEQTEQIQEGYNKVANSFASTWSDLVEGIEESMNRYK